MANLAYNLGKQRILSGTINLSTHVIKAMLVTSSYVADANHDFVDDGGADDPIDHELSGTGYTAGFAGSGRITLTTKTFEEDDTNNRAEFHAADLAWPGIDAGIAAGIVIYRHLTSDALSTLLCYIDDGGLPITTNGGQIDVTWNAEGIYQI